MPKRTNDFQRLIYLVRHNLADGAKVTESKLMRDRLTGRYREVDVVIEGRVGQQPVVVSLECRDHKRVADVSWVDAMKAKHERLDTNALLLASRMGFTPEAKDVAKKYGLELFSLQDLDAADIPALLGKAGSLWMKLISLTAQKVRIRVADAGGLASEVVVTSPDNLLFLEDHSELCQVKELVDRLLRSPGARDYLMKEGKEDHVWFEFKWEPPCDHEGKQLFMKKIEPAVYRAVECIHVVGPCKIEIAPFRMRHSKLGETKIAWGKAAIAGQDAMVVATIAASGDAMLTLNFSGAASATMPTESS
jgi:hypothetical protein